MKDFSITHAENTAPQMDLITGDQSDGLQTAESLGSAQSRTRTLVVSDIPGMAEMVGRGLAKDDGLEVVHQRIALADLVADPDFDLSSTDLIVFQIRAGNDADIAAIRTVKANGPEDLKVLGVTSDLLSLASSRALMDAGVDEVMPVGAKQPESQDAQAVNVAVDDAREDHDTQVTNGVILAVAGARGGIGTTSFALNLATLLARRGKKDEGPAPKVAIVDLDYQNGVLGASIDIQDTGAYLDLLKGDIKADRAFVRRSMIHYEGASFDVLAAPTRIAPLDAFSAETVAMLLDELRLTYDYVVLDLPRALVDWVDPILARADRFFILGDTSVHTVRQMRRMTDLYTDDHAAIPLEPVVSMKSKPFRAGADIKEAERFLERKLEHWIPLDAKSAALASDHGKPILLARPKSAIAKAMAPIITSIREIHVSNIRRRA